MTSQSQAATTADRLVQAFAEARENAKAAYRHHMSTWPLTETGHTRDGCGLAFAYVRCRGRKVKAILVDKGLASSWRGLQLSLLGFDVPDSGITSQEVAVRAAADTLNQLVGDLGHFWFESRLD